METTGSIILRLAGKVLATAAVIALAILAAGYFLHWEGAVQFSNAFFVTGGILIVLGVFSVTGGFAQRADFKMTYTETAAQANTAERGRRMMSDIDQRYGAMLLLISAGLLLIGISMLVTRFLR